LEIYLKQKEIATIKQEITRAESILSDLKQAIKNGINIHMLEESNNLYFYYQNPWLAHYLNHHIIPVDQPCIKMVCSHNRHHQLQQHPRGKCTEIRKRTSCMAEGTTAFT
jgi:hypothetical protein